MDLKICNNCKDKDNCQRYLQQTNQLENVINPIYWYCSNK